MNKTMKLLAVLVAVLALAALPALAQTSPAAANGAMFSGPAQFQADMVFSLGGGVAVCWSIANLKKLKLFKNLHGAGTVAVSIVVSYLLTGLVLFAEGAFAVPKLLLIGAIVAKMANGYYNANQKATPATPAAPTK